ncbi:phosphate signaling complex PhoU family protein [Sulfurimonas autotrophica]|uniref:Phosphate transport system regulatory protein PhoU, putative n=1 Tax=Sulfurimonas autotrophica (strain ATCC BAA-671 / DSM 16294 / JCM 11897 / OK10) TaxID=563040 RepID=E0UQP2_SULAO|nr:PhoU domain-containing protein [Sulfurimonas autotrophica]ADN09914.1 phosphate transport system regulatory protein PhoU, putative [Sulfurimonas autotrophica DSM 16294]
MLPTFKTNLDDIREKITNIGESLVTANTLILQALQGCDEAKFNEARNSIKNITSKTDEIDNAIIKVLALFTPEAKDLRQVVAYFKITNELARACSNTRSFIRGFTDVCKELDVKEINEYAILMQTSTVKAIQTTVKMINIDDTDELQEMYEEVLIEENKADDLYEMIERKLVEQAESSNTFEKYHKMLRALRKSEKIASRAISVANLLVYIKIGGNIHN